MSRLRLRATQDAEASLARSVKRLAELVNQMSREWLIMNLSAGENALTESGKTASAPDPRATLLRSPIREDGSNEGECKSASRADSSRGQNLKPATERRPDKPRDEPRQAV